MTSSASSRADRRSRGGGWPPACVVLGALLGVVMLGSFALAMMFDVPVLSDEHPNLGVAGAGAALAGVSLLTVDALVPVPSSGVMVALGALFGTIGGATLSLLGSGGAALLGWWIGRRGGPWMQRLAGSDDRLVRSLRRGGVVAVITSRPIPILAETVVVVAGAAGMPARRVVVGALVGSVPQALAYAAVGAAASDVDVAVPVFGAVVVLAGIAWLVSGRSRVRTSSAATRTSVAPTPASPPTSPG